MVPPPSEEYSQSSSGYELKDDFYEVEDLVNRRLSKDSLWDEHRVRFKGYGLDPDMWLPSSLFNRSCFCFLPNFELTSKFGRKQKHNLDPENVSEQQRRKCVGQKRKHKTSEDRSAQIIKPPMKKPPESTEEAEQAARC